MNCYLDQETDQIIADTPSVQRKCLETLGKLSKAVSYKKPEIDCPELPPLSQEQIQQMQKETKIDKALAWDGISDIWIRNT